MSSILSNLKKFYKGFIYLIFRYLFFKKYIHIKCDLLNAEFNCFIEDVIGRHLFKYGSHERDNSNFLLRNLSLKENEIALDIGANLGWYSVLLNRISSSKSKIYSFEPDEKNFYLLKNNLTLNHCTNVFPVNKAISNENGTSDFYKYPSKNSGRHSLIPAIGLEKCNVETIILDDFLKDNELSRVKFLKIDIEGYEYFALSGASKVLKQDILIMMEYSPRLYTESCSAEKLKKLLYDNSFKPHVLNQASLKQISGDNLDEVDDQIDVFWKK